MKNMLYESKLYIYSYLIGDFILKSLGNFHQTIKFNIILTYLILFSDNQNPTQLIYAYFDRNIIKIDK